MKILALTSIRSEYDLLSSLFFKLNDDENITLKLMVGGAHLSPSFGYTVEDIEKDGFDILLKVESLIDSDSHSSRLKSAAVLLLSSIDSVRSFSPDLILYAGDREEVMIGALLGGYLGVPSIHFYGGDHAADGHIDNPIRHAVSKLSTCHFVSNSEHSQRLQALGESSSRIFNIGSIGLDKFLESDNVENIRFIASQKNISKPSALFIYHPIGDESDIADVVVENALLSLLGEGYHVFVGTPNSDPGNIKIRKTIEEFSKKYSDVTSYGNLPRKEFISLFKACSLIVGNSSAGLLESASIPIPCINIGERQRGRLCAENVIFVDTTKSSITDAIKHVSSATFKENLKFILNPYGKGDSAQKAFDLIKSINFNSLLLKKEDPLSGQK